MLASFLALLATALVATRAGASPAPAPRSDCYGSSDASCEYLVQQCVNNANFWASSSCVAAATCAGVETLLDVVCCRTGNCVDPAQQNSLDYNAVYAPIVGSCAYASGGCPITEQDYIDFYYGTLSATGSSAFPTSADVVRTWWNGITTWAATGDSVPYTNFNDWLHFSSGGPATANAKAVVAHHIVGFTFSYTQQDWANDISLASSMGIDAFALNFGRDPWQPAQLASAYAAAQQHGNFKVFLSFDMTSLSCTSAGDAQSIRSLLNTYAAHPAQFVYNGRPLASTFAGQTCTFGADSVQDGWTSAVRTGVTTQYWFVPSFFVDPATFSSYTVTDGEFNWNGGWPMNGNADETFDSDSTYIGDNGGKIFIAAASPWFFAHYSDKNWIYRSDDWLWNNRWEELVTHRDQIDIVEIITWNDYSESHYVGNINPDGTPPTGTTWVNGFDHQGWLNMVPYYAQAFKTGTYPAITNDHLYIWARPHPASATATSDPLPRPSNYQFTSDELWAVAFATAPGTVQLTSGSNTQQFNVQTGVNKINLALAPGQIRGTLTRNGATVRDVNPGGAFTYTTTPALYNYNAFVAWA